ncbi:MAG: sensor histidine kinase [Rubrivivax sp.]|nr:MAG: sensor histidine kinase [Rubrivivax sp.]
MWAATGFGPSQDPSEDAARQPTGAQAAAQASPFNVCHVGVVLRVVLGVQILLWLACLHGAMGWMDWVTRWAAASAEALPACLLWLVLVCAGRPWLVRQRATVQWGAAMLVGGLSGAYGHVQFALLGVWLDMGGLSPWALAGPVTTGAALAAVCLAWLRQRQGRAVPEQTQARLVELQARIRPHFLFNTLNTAIALVQVDPQRAEAVLEDLAELFRRALASPATQSTWAEEVDLARRYLGIESLRFGDRMTVRWALEADADEVMVPALLLQPLVENAVRHGIEADPRGGWLRVESRLQGDRLAIIVSNSLPLPEDGQARAAGRPGHGIALRNVRQRLVLMHDVEAQFEAGPRPVSPGAADECYVVRVSIPARRQPLS